MIEILVFAVLTAFPICIERSAALGHRMSVRDSMSSAVGISFQAPALSSSILGEGQAPRFFSRRLENSRTRRACRLGPVSGHIPGWAP